MLVVHGWALQARGARAGRAHFVFNEVFIKNFLLASKKLLDVKAFKVQTSF